MRNTKLLAVGLLIFAFVALLLGCVSALVAVQAHAEFDAFSGRSFFRICSTSSPAECASFTWLHLLIFCIGSFCAGTVLAVLGARRLGSANA